MAALCCYGTVENFETNWTDEIRDVAASVRDIFLELCCAKPSEHRHFFSSLSQSPTNRSGDDVTGFWFFFMREGGVIVYNI